jgi:hypothetical protein
VKLIDELNGRVQSVCPTLQDAPPPNVRVAVGNMLPELTSPEVACTTSTTDVIVKVSWAVSTVFEIWNSQVYASPTFVGLSQPLRKLIP